MNILKKNAKSGDFAELVPESFWIALFRSSQLLAMTLTKDLVRLVCHAEFISASKKRESEMNSD